MTFGLVDNMSVDALPENLTASGIMLLSPGRFQAYIARQLGCPPEEGDEAGGWVAKKGASDNGTV